MLNFSFLPLTSWTNGDGGVCVQEILQPGDGEGQGAEALVWDRAGVHTPRLRQGGHVVPEMENQQIKKMWTC